MRPVSSGSRGVPNAVSILLRLLLSAGLLAVMALVVSCEEEVEPIADQPDVSIGDDVAPPPDEPVTCEPDLEECDGLCVDLMTDRRHCGECGNACSGSHSCVDGTCRLICPGEQKPCGDGCHDLASSTIHCGQCEAACAPGEICQEGTCTLYCREEQMACGETCVDITRDPAHCGGCDQSCEAGFLCGGGQCLLDCPPGFTDCAGSCINTGNDPEHCGECNFSCPAGQFCDAGVCSIICPYGQTLCGDTCANLLTDHHHCGACGSPCHSSQVCSEGSCQVSCAPGLTDCDGNCVALGSDPEHCGECDLACEPGLVCVDGHCLLDCLPDQELCTTGCSDLQTDRRNCGECDHLCPQGETCVEGECTLICPAGQEPCEEMCINPLTDIQHCGECGNSCPKDHICLDGDCVHQCAQGQIICAEACVDPKVDRNNCGICGTICPEDKVCRNGECVIDCPDGFKACDGVCVHIGTDSNNCGDCQVACTGSEVCTGGTCYAEVSSVSLSCSSMDLVLGEQEELVATVSPADASNMSIDWTTSSPQSVTVEDGVVTATGPGSAIISATSVSANRSASCTVSVVVPATGVTVSPSHLALRPNQDGQLSASIEPPEATNKSVVWSSDDPNLVTVSQSGLVRSLGGTGQTTINASTVDGIHTAHATVNVADILVTGVSVSPTRLSLVPGASATLSATITPTDAANQNILWSSSSSGVASVAATSGQVTANSAGTAVISAVTADGGHTAECIVTVAVPVAGVSIEPAGHHQLNRGEDLPLSVTVVPENATNKSVVWDTLDPLVAIVDAQGQVFATGEGETVVSATTVQGDYYDQVTVAVRVAVLDVEVHPSELLIWPGESAPLQVSVVPEDATNPAVVVHSSNTAVATVDSTFRVTGVASGLANITVVALDNLQATSTPVTVAVPVSGVTVSPKELILPSLGEQGQLSARISPTNATVKRVQWTSSHPERVSVNNSGLVTVLDIDEQPVTITATTEDGGLTDTATVISTLYTFTSHTFTTCGQSGPTGPSQSQCFSAYSNAPWASETQFFSVPNEPGIQHWTVPASGTYRIEVWGAEGGRSTNRGNGGRGARMRGDFDLTQGDVLKILVGQQGGADSAGGGGGGTFVTTQTNSPIIIAGGGGGRTHYTSAIGTIDGWTSPSGRNSSGNSNSGGSNGSGGQSSNNHHGGGGGGLTGNGALTSPSGNRAQGGFSFTNGGEGGTFYYTYNNGWGGFGGGGRSGHDGGGGGGYSGGAGGWHSTQGSGGGGSWNSGNNPDNQNGVRTGHGQVTITRVI